MNNQYLEEALGQINDKGLKRSLKTVEEAQGPEIKIDGRNLLNFCSNNYLGLADDDRLIEAAVASMQKHGFGSGASRLVCGNMIAHSDLETKIAKFKGTERCLVFNTGYMANIGIISSLFGAGDIIFIDRLNHASIIDGVLLSKAQFKRYPHRDMPALEEMLKNASGYNKRAVITDSVFSMDGDIAPLDRIVKLAKKYKCTVMADEAHALGVLGRNGKGAAEYFGLEGEIDIQMGTLSKAAGSFGAYCCGSNALISFLINKARSFIYTTGLPPSAAAASSKAIDIIIEDEGLRRKLWDNTNYMLNELKLLGFDTMDSQTPIIPVLIGDPHKTIEFSQKLFEAGIFISAIRPPTVPQNTSRLRLTVMATHSADGLNFALESLKRIGKELCLI